MARKPSGPRMRMPRRSTSRPQPTPPASVSAAELRDDLEIACLDAMRGDPPGPFLAKTLERACEEVLRGQGLAAARVSVVSTRAGTRVTVTLPPELARVGQIVLSLS